MAYLDDTNYIKTDEHKIKYFNLEQKVYTYAKEFYKEAVPFFNMYYGELDRTINDDILPLYCFDEMAEIVQAVEEGRDSYVAGGCVTAMGQAVIRIGLKSESDTLTKTLKRTIRHEICHYCLYIIKRGWNDDDLDFWCYAYVFDAKPYAKMNKDDKARFEMFKEIYDEHVAALPHNVKVYTVQEMMQNIHDEDLSAYKEKVLGVANQLTAMFQR